MKPRRKDDQSKGLARWRWIKSYLGPALKYAGITSEEFDKIIFGGDQHVEQRATAQTGGGIPNIAVEINGVTYSIAGDIPPQDGYISVIFEYGPQVVEIDPTSSPASFIFSGAINVFTPPTWILGNDLNVRASVNPDGSLGSNAKVIIPIAKRQGQTLEVYFQASIRYQTIGTLGIDGYLF